MKESGTVKANRKQGSAILAVLLIVIIASAIAIVLLSTASNSATLTRRTLDYQRAKIAAEAGLDYARARLVENMRHYQFTLTDSQLATELAAITPPPGLGPYLYETPQGAVAFEIEIESPPQMGTLLNGRVAPGMEGRWQVFTLRCGAINPASGVGAVLEEKVQAVALYLNRYGVFYDKDLEIDPGPPMEFWGRIHGNTDIYLEGPLDLHDQVTSHGKIIHGRKDDGTTTGDVYIENDSGQLTSMMDGLDIIDSRNPDWMVEALSLWDGRVQSEAHGIPELTPPIDPVADPHLLIERPLAAGAPGYDAEDEGGKLANTAAITVHVDAAGGVTVTDYFGTDLTATFNQATPSTSSGKNVKDADGHYVLDTEGSIGTDQQFFDGREQTSIKPVDIYVDQLLQEYPDMASGLTYGVDEGRGVVYVTRDDPDGPGGVMPAVRLRNATELAPGGLSFASDLPIYVEGDYNVVNKQPAMVAGDAVTFLSKAWQDSSSAGNLTDRTTVDTTYNTTIMTGNSETIVGGNYNGGLENALRFLEHWSGKTVTYRGSVIDLWSSQIADGLWGVWTYYSPPDRDWGYDPMLLTASPPGMPQIFAVEQLAWKETTWQEAGWD